MSMADADRKAIRDMGARDRIDPPLDSGGFEILSPTDQANEDLGYDADVADSSQYCSTCGQFIGSWWGPDIICRCG
jgi:hypothetical protein